MLVAWMLTTIKSHRARRMILGFLFWPSLISAVASAHIISMVFSSGSSGLFNRIVMLFGGYPQDWLGNPNTALIALMVVPFLLGFSGRMIIYYAAMLGVPETYYEASKFNTSSKVRPLFNITLPLIKNAIVLNLVLSLIEGVRILAPMQLVDGVADETMSVVLYIFNLAFYPQALGSEGLVDGRRLNQFGRASAYAMIVFVVILVLTLIQFKLTGKEAENVSAG